MCSDALIVDWMQATSVDDKRSEDCQWVAALALFRNNVRFYM